MEYQSKLKENIWVDVSTLADWLNIKDEKVDVSADKASKLIQNITFKAQNGGSEGNSITIEYIGGGIAGSELVIVNNKAIQVQIEDGVSTSQQIKTAVNGSVNAFSLVLAESTAIIPQNIVGATPLEGGSDPILEHVKLVRRLELFLNSSCDRIETFMQSVVLPKQFTEIKDGNNSNVVIPSQWPIQTVDEVIIDYSGKFPASLALNEDYYFNRGAADKRQSITDTELRIIGSDIVIRDNGENYIIGPFLIGSSLGSIKLKYTSGWTREYTRELNESTGLLEIDPNDVPYDLVLAVLQLSEFWYYQRENRDIGVIGKGVMGENYSKREAGIPSQIIDIIEPYKDESFGSIERPQDNNMGINF